MEAADVFCLPTELAACPLVLLQASAEALPSVAFHSGGVPEIVFHGQTGLLSYPGDTPALANNLLRLLTDPGLARRMGAVAQSVAATDFDATTTATRWVQQLARFANVAT